MDSKMILSKILHILRKKEYQRVVENIISLSGLQIAGYLLPLITLPYLVRVLGPERYGLIAFATALVFYFVILTNYGFNLSATREISICREDPGKVSEIFSSVLFIKFILMLLSFLILAVVVLGVEQFRAEWLVYFFSFGMVIGNVLFPVWFFQGIEKMKYITVLNVLAQAIFTVSVFIFIRTTADYLYVPLINSVGFLVAGLLGLRIALKDYPIQLKIPDRELFKHHLQEGWHIFLSSAAVTLYTTSNTFILGVLTNNVTVSYYAVAEKVILAVLGLLNPLSQALFPHISRVVDESHKKGVQFLQQITKIMIAIGLSLSLLLFVFSGLIVNILFGDQYTPAITVLRILSFLPLIVGLSNVFGIQTMIPLNYKRALSRIVLAAGGINIILALALVPLFQEVGTALSFLTAETFITLTMFLFLQRKGIKMIGA